MAEMAVSFLLENLASFLQNEVQNLKNEFQLQQTVSEEVESIRDDLQIMQASLRAAELVQEKDDELKEWIRQVREIAHDTEDVIDEFKLHHPDPNEHQISAFLCNFCGIIQKLEGRHQIIVELRRIRARITKISTWQLNHHGQLSAFRQGSSARPASHDLLLDSSALVGIDEPKEQLIRWLTEGNSKRKVISVVGMGGSGKTTLVKQVYDDVRVKKHFQVHAWITISQPLRMGKLLRSIVQQLFRPVPEGIDTMSYDLLREVIKSFLHKKRYLIVLDSVWHLNEWEALNYALANNNHSSRVILTTRKADVAVMSCIQPEDQSFDLRPLSQNASRDLFYRRSFRGSTCPSSLVDISERILERCEGLPLAIVAISGVLATKNQSITEWETVYRSLGAEIDDNDKLKNLKEVLLLSFNDLPYHLRSCFLYLGIFPENHQIETMRLIRLWIAEGFVEFKEGKTREEVAEDYLNELLNRNLIQVATKKSDGAVKTWRIHDLLREIVISKSKDQNFAVVAKEQNGEDATWPEKVRRLSIHNSLNNVQRNWNVSHLRTLVVDPLSSATLQDLCPGRLKLLKVLDLRGANLEVFPGEIVNLRLLVYLSLRDTKIRSIPSSIGKLQNLETLDLKHTFVTELPIEILNLNELRHLLVYRYEFKYYSRFHSKFGFKSFAGGIGALRLLQKLCFIEVDHRNASELGKLTQLRRLGILNLRRENGRMLCTSIEKLTKLRALSIVSSTKDEVIDLQHLSSPPPYLQRLYLYGRLEKIPEWIPSLQSLVMVYLKWSSLEDDPLESLQQLPNLLHLELLQVCQGDNLTFKAGGFEKLKILSIDKSDKLRRIEVEKGAMPCIEKISILRCKSLEKVPLGIEHLSMLKVLEFFEMEELINSLRPGVKGGDYGRVAQIPEVYFTYCRNGEWEVYSLESSGERVPEPVEPHVEGIGKK